MLVRVMTPCFDPVRGAFNYMSLQEFLKEKKHLSIGARHCCRGAYPSLTTY